MSHSQLVAELELEPPILCPLHSTRLSLRSPQPHAWAKVMGSVGSRDLMGLADPAKAQGLGFLVL